MDTPISLEDFRILMGIPLGPHISRSGSQTSTGTTTTIGRGKPGPARVPPVTWIPHIFWRGKDPEEESSIYFAILHEEARTRRKYLYYQFLAYAGLIAQLILSAVLIILGALPGHHSIPIAALGAVNGVITGVLSLIKGQGFPNRLTKYLDSLRRVKDDIDLMERELRVGKKPVSYGAAIALRDEYGVCREDEETNHPDTWTSGLSTTTGMKGRYLSA
jgi:hypothetical protein